jgi:hypothetical protein
VFDTETTADEIQRFLYGSYRYCRWTDDAKLECVQEGIIHADDLAERDPEALAVLKHYCDTHEADVVDGQRRELGAIRPVTAGARSW